MSMLAQIRSNKFTLPAAFLYILLKCVSGMLTQMQVSTLSLFSLSSSRLDSFKPFITVLKIYCILHKQYAMLISILSNHVINCIYIVTNFSVDYFMLSLTSDSRSGGR